MVELCLVCLRPSGASSLCVLFELLPTVQPALLIVFVLDVGFLLPPLVATELLSERSSKACEDRRLS